MSIRGVILFGIPAIIFIALAVTLDNPILMWIGTGFVVLAGAIFAFDQM
jgi:hypothetical protein